MPITPSWNKWIVLSLCKYSKGYFGNDYLWIQGEEVDKKRPAERFELRFLGPDIISQTQDMSTLHLTVNCQIATVRTPIEIEKHLLRVGKAQCLLAQCIPVYRYGTDPILDDKSLFGHLQQISNVDTTSFGTVDSVSSVERSTVEATYKISI
jgi:hypothetical protein